jgi:hypothetical protein
MRRAGVSEPGDEERFEDALRGASADPPLAWRLGEALRTQHRTALERMDQLAKQRVWNELARRINASGTRYTFHAAGFAKAAAFVFIGLATGWFVGRTGGPGVSETGLEFSYGDLERSRGDMLERTVAVPRPMDAMRALTEAFIHDSVAFEVYSLPARGDRRVVFMLAAAVPPESARALEALGIASQAGAMHAVTFTMRTGGG